MMHAFCGDRNLQPAYLIILLLTSGILKSNASIVLLADLPPQTPHDLLQIDFLSLQS